MYICRLASLHNARDKISVYKSASTRNFRKTSRRHRNQVFTSISYLSLAYLDNKRPHRYRFAIACSKRVSKLLPSYILTERHRLPSLTGEFYFFVSVFFLVFHFDFTLQDVICFCTLHVRALLRIRKYLYVLL